MGKDRLRELDKLENYRKEREIPYVRRDVMDGTHFERHQVAVLDEDGNRIWDAICQYGSYGYESGLLEVMGDIVDEELHGDQIEGFLTANEVIRRVEIAERRPA